MVALVNPSAISPFLKRLKIYDPHHRSLVLIDERFPSRIAAGLIDHPYDQSLAGDLTPYFDKALDVLTNTPADVVLSAHELMLLHAIGRYRITIVHCYPDGKITITNGETAPIEDNLGLDKF